LSPPPTAEEENQSTAALAALLLLSGARIERNDQHRAALLPSVMAGDV
jgi:hypothetical protein